MMMRTAKTVRKVSSAPLPRLSARIGSQMYIRQRAGSCVHCKPLLRVVCRSASLRRGKEDTRQCNAYRDNSFEPVT